MKGDDDVISNPSIGQRVQVWYGRRSSAAMPHHGRIGTVRVVGRGRPRNHAIDLGGIVIVVPAGNLRTPPVNPGGVARIR